MGSSYSTVAGNISEGNSSGILLSNEGRPTSHDTVLGNVAQNNLFDLAAAVPRAQVLRAISHALASSVRASA